MINEELDEEYVEEDYENYSCGLKAWVMPIGVAAFFPIRISLVEWLDL